LEYCGAAKRSSRFFLEIFAYKLSLQVSLRSKFEEPVEVKMPGGFTFNDFEKGVADADPKDVEKEIQKKLNRKEE
jgi:hypothetical protein